MEDQKLQLRELGGANTYQVACPGMYKACVIMDSCIYQIGEETPDRMLALAYCEEYSGAMQPVQIFDDKGKCHIIDGKLKNIYDDTHDNSFLKNAVTFFDRLMKQSYVSKSQLLDLKKKFKTMKENGMTEYNTLLNRITNISNKVPGKNDPEILREVYDDFQTLLKQ